MLYSTGDKKGEQNEDTSVEYKKNYRISNRDRSKAHNSGKGSECRGGWGAGVMKELVEHSGSRRPRSQRLIRVM